MQISLSTSHLIKCCSLVLSFLAVVIVTHKIDALDTLHILSSLKYVYVLFFAGIFFTLLYFWHVHTLRHFFFSTALAIFILMIGCALSEHMHALFWLTVGLWWIGLITEALWRVNSKRLPAQNTTPVRIWDAKTICFVVCAMICFGFFGVDRLDKSIYVDEKLWTYGAEHRIEKYWHNIIERDWKNTRPSDKPGVTLAIISGVGLLHATPSDFYHNYHGRSAALLDMLFAMRVPIVIFCAMMIPVFFFVIARWSNKTIATIATIFISTSPILIGMARIINPDAISWIFLPLTLCAHFVFVRRRARVWLYMTGVFFGLSLLTKYIANIFFIYFLIDIATRFLCTKKIHDPVHYMRDKMWDIATILTVALSTFYLLYPGVWVKPDRLLRATIWSDVFHPIWLPVVLLCVFVVAEHVWLRSRYTIRALQKCKKHRNLFAYAFIALFAAGIAFVVCNTTLHMPFGDLEAILAAPKADAQTALPLLFTSGFYAALYAVSPIVFAGLCGAIFVLYKKVRTQNRKHIDDDIIHILLFVVLFYAGCVAGFVAPTVRYQIVLYPIIFICAAYGWSGIAQRIAPRHGVTVVCVATIFVHFAILHTIAPHYFSYSNILLPQSYSANPKDMGDGTYEIARYLNNLPNAKNVSVWSDKNGVCVLFDGYCNARPHMGEFDANGGMFDYYVISHGSENHITTLTAQRLTRDPSYPLRLDRLYDYPDSVFVVHPGNRTAQYLRVIDGSHITVLEQ